MRRRSSGSTSAIAAAVLALLGVLPGCEGADPAPAAPSQKIGQGVTLRYWAPRWLDIPYSEQSGAELYRKLEETTGVAIELIHPMARSASEQLKELQSSGAMPDIIEWSWLRSYPGGPGKAIDEGLILSLGDLIKRHAPNMLEVLRKSPDVARAVSTADGRLYAFPDLQVDPTLRAQSGPIFRKDWLEKVHMEPPQTVGQWYEVLRALRAESFGTPGTAAEYPFCILAFTPWLQDNLVLPYFTESNAFAGAYGVAHGFYRDGGKIKYGPAQPAYRRVLELLTSWFEEGLINPAGLVPEAGGEWWEVIAKSGSWIAGLDAAAYLSLLKYVPAPIPRPDASAPSGTSFVGPRIGSPYAAQRAAAVCTASAHATEAVRWLDVAYGEWGNRLLNFGIDGKSYELVRGAPVLVEAVRKDLARGELSVNYLASTLYASSRGILGGPFDLSADLVRQEIEALMPGSSATFVGWAQGAYVDPAAALADDPAARERHDRALLPIEDYVNRTVLEFISGRRSLEDFDDFVRELDERGLPAILETLQRADAAWRAKPLMVR